MEQYLQIILCRGAPGSGKSTWAKSMVEKEPDNYLRINNDDLRSSFNNSVYSKSNEKIISETRKFLIKTGLNSNKNILIDNVNCHSKHFEEAVAIAKASGRNVIVEEKPFYLDLNELIARDSKREGKACVGEKIVRRWFKDLGGESFKNYQPKKEIITQMGGREGEWKPATQNIDLQKAIICDNDGTLSIIHKGRNPYDASTSDQDLPHEHVIEMVKLYYKNGYKILFVSGREEKDREPTEKFYQKYLPEVEYELFMRPTGNTEKDVIIKERIYNKQIKGKYFISAWVDDRLQVCKWVWENGLPLFRVNNPESSF